MFVCMVLIEYPELHAELNVFYESHTEMEKADYIVNNM